MKPISEMTPAELRIACAIRNNILDGQEQITFLDYEHDLNVCMKLMEKVWEKEPTADIGSNSLTRIKGYCVHCFSWRVDAETIPVAIMRAFLTVMEEK